MCSMKCYEEQRIHSINWTFTEFLLRCRCCSWSWRYNGNHRVKKPLPSRAYILMEDAFLYILVGKTLCDLLFHEKSETQVLQVNGDIYTEHLRKDTWDTDSKLTFGWRMGDFLCLLTAILSILTFGGYVFKIGYYPKALFVYNIYFFYKKVA